MTLLPVIARELRAEARRPFTHWLRVVGSGTLLIVGMLQWEHQGLGPGKGGTFFSILHATLFWTIWLVVPVMTSDCISREKREGTLGLLFLTPLRALDVVLAKVLAHGLRAAALAVAALPVLSIPFLYGGVGWQEAVASGLINFSAFCWALGAGVLASSSNERLTRALILSALWGGLFFLLFLLLQGLALSAAANPANRAFSGGMRAMGPWWMAIAELLSDGLRVVVAFQWLWSPRWGRVLPANFASGWLINLSLVAFFSLLGQRLVLTLAAHNVRRLWQDRSLSPRQEKLEKQFCTPRFGQGLFRSWMRQLLERNPVGWLERRTWRSRLVMWGWLAVMIALYSAALSQPATYASALSGIQTAMAILLLTSMALSAAGSFRRERETGFLELMLVTPLRVGQIVNGRLRALWGQFLPASVLFLTLWVFLAREFGRMGMSPDALVEQKIWLWLFCASAATLPVAGLWCSLHCRLYIVSLFATVALGFFLPMILVAGLTTWMEWGTNMANYALFLVLLLGLGSALLVPRRVLRDYAGTLVAPPLAGGAAALAVWLIASRHPAMGFVDDTYTMRALMTLVLLQLTIAVILLLLLHRALVRRKFAFPQ